MPRTLVATASLALCLPLTAASFAGGVCPCLTDFNTDGVTDGADLTILLSGWGGKGEADVDASGTVDAADLTVLLAAWGPCAPPDNDVCAGGAELISGIEAWVPFCTAAATTSGPALASFCGGVEIAKDIWFSHQVSAPGLLRIETCGSDFDTVLAAYRNASAPDRCLCPPAASVQVVACNDDAPGCGFQSAIEFPVGELDCLLIRVGGFVLLGNPQEGSGLLYLKEIHRGDRCDIAHELPSSLFVTRFGTNAADTWVEPDQSSCAQGDTQDEWYRFVMPCDGTLSVTTCDPSTNFDTTLAIYSGCGGPQLACNDDSTLPGCQLDGLNRKSRVEIVATGGEVLLIRVSGFQGAVGQFELILDVDCNG